jgi:hypothetical protein
MSWNIVNSDSSSAANKLQALALVSDSYKYLMDLTTNGVVIIDAIKHVQTNKEKLTTITTMSSKENDNGKESKEPDYDEDRVRRRTREGNWRT